jgi:hypothetical protein
MQDPVDALPGAAELGDVLIAAAQGTQAPQLVLVGSIIVLAVSQALNVAVFHLQLLPLLLQLAGLGTTSLVGRG